MRLTIVSVTQNFINPASQDSSRGKQLMPQDELRFFYQNSSGETFMPILIKQSNYCLLTNQIIVY